MFRSIYSKILTSQLILVVIVTITMGTSAYLIISPSLQKIQQEKILFIARAWAKEVNGFIAARKRLLTDVAKAAILLDDSGGLDVENVQQYLKDISDKFPVVSVLNETGNEDVQIVFGNKIEGRIQYTQTILKALERPNEAVVDLITTLPTDEQTSLGVAPPYLEFAVRAQVEGKNIAVIMSRIPLRLLADMFADFAEFHFEGTGFLSLYDSVGTTILHRKSDKVLQRIHLPAAADGTVAVTDGVFRHDTIHGVKGFTAYFPVPDNKLIVAATLPDSQFFKTQGSLKGLFVFIGMVVVVVCFFLSAIIARGISRPLLKLSGVVQRLAQGEWDLDVEVDSSDETGRLSRSFKQMSLALHQMIIKRDNELALRRKMEQAIHTSHLELDQIFNRAAGGMLVVGLDRQILRVNDTFVHMLGLQREEVVERRCCEIFEEQFCGVKQCLTEIVLRDEIKIEQEVEKKLQDGSIIICNLVAAPLYGSDGEMIGVIEDYRNITKTKKAEELVKMSGERYRLLFDSAPDGIFVLSRQGIIVDCNQSMSKIYGRTVQELVGNHYSSYNAVDADTDSSLDFENMKMIDQAEDEVSIFHPDGKRVTLWRKINSIRDARGRLSGILIYDRDISRQREVEELRGDMERIARHDLKTPLNGIISLPMLIQMDGELSQKQVRYLKLIEDAGYQMLSMINSSLDLYKMEHGTYSFEPVPVNFCAIINKINRELWADMQRNGNRIDVFLNDKPTGQASSFLVLGDELLCYSMLANLIKNAVESSVRGETVTVSLKNREKGALIKIHNNKIVPPEVRNFFFEKYSTAGKDGGTGLGTYSARLMARTQQGEITMVSSAGEGGTSVIIEMPTPEDGAMLKIPPRQLPSDKGSYSNGLLENSFVRVKEDHTVKPRKKAKDVQVLLAEDDIINQTLAVAILQEKGVSVTAVDDGLMALDAMKNRSFDLVLMDMQMPKLSGVEATRTIRQQEKGTGERLPIIAVTGLAEKSNTDRFFAAGVDEMVPKPIQIDHLWSIVSKYLQIDEEDTGQKTAAR